jgi:hypothetical protein
MMNPGLVITTVGPAHTTVRGKPWDQVVHVSLPAVLHPFLVWKKGGDFVVFRALALCWPLASGLPFGRGGRFHSDCRILPVINKGVITTVVYSTGSHTPCTMYTSYNMYRY